MKLAERMTRLTAETDLEVLPRALALERLGKEIIHFETADPDFLTPPSAFEARVAGTKSGPVKHSASRGQLELRTRLAHVAGNSRGARFLPEQVVLMPGAKAILFYTILALIDEGDEVLYPNPGYPAYESIIAFAGGKPVPYPLREGNDFQLDLGFFADHLTRRTRLLILNSPSNPTGAVESLAGLRELVELIGSRDVWVISDETYSSFVYKRDHASISCFDAMSEKTIVIDAFSKAFSKTGLGYGIMPRDLVAQLSKLIKDFICYTPAISERAGLAALEAREATIQQTMQEYRRRRDMMVHRLSRIPGVRCQSPGGGFYVFPNVSAFGKSSMEIADCLLEQAGVACLAGSEFGARGEGFLRLSFATSMEKIREGLDRIAATLANIRTTEVAASHHN